MLELAHQPTNSDQKIAHTSWLRDLTDACMLDHDRKYLADMAKEVDRVDAGRSEGLSGVLARLQHKFAYPPDMALRIEAEVQARTHHLYKQAHYDFLTHLPNRASLYEYLADCIANAQSSQKSFGLIFMDLDGFKQVNDSLGHHVGDELLRLVSARVLAVMKANDFVARLGGDEFVLVMPDVAKQASLAAICERLIREVCRPYWIENHAVFTSPSMGVARFHEDGRVASDLIDRADQALYYAKEQGGKTYAFYQSLPAFRTHQDQPIQACLSEAVATGGLQLRAQHQVDIKHDRFVGVALTLHWPDAPDVHAISDLEALLIDHVDAPLVNRWLWDSVCFYLSRWQHWAADWSVSLPRLSSVLTRPETVALLTDALQQNAISPEQVHLSVDVAQMGDALQRPVLDALAAAGFQLTLSGVGRVPLDLSQLGQLSLSEIQLDETWLAQQLETVTGTRCVRAVIDLAHTLDASVVATGVTDSGRVERLRNLGCDLAQGPFWGAPTPIEEFM